jgi:GT2 family glycosyltransferase
VTRKKIATVIVTYNRKQLLERCLNAVVCQTIQCDRVFIIDNASDDGTPEFLQEKGYLNNSTVEYIRLSENTGGAGGFAKGMQIACEANYDWLWLMDDDGYPALDCLEKLLEYQDKFDIIGPAVVSPENPEELTWKLRVIDRSGYFSPRKYISSHKEAIANSTGDIYDREANFFNGIIINRTTIEKIGYVNPELFIWGDEYEYALRCKKNNCRVATQVHSLFFHPVKEFSANKLKFFYLFRNRMFIYYKYADVMYSPVIRFLFPAYIFMKYLATSPSFSLRYLLQLFKAVLKARQGKLIPYQN